MSTEMFVYAVELVGLWCSFVYAHCHVEDSNDRQNGPHTSLLCTKRNVSGGALVFVWWCVLIYFRVGCNDPSKSVLVLEAAICVNGCSVFSGRSSSSTCWCVEIAGWRTVCVLCYSSNRCCIILVLAKVVVVSFWTYQCLFLLYGYWQRSGQLCQYKCVVLHASSYLCL